MYFYLEQGMTRCFKDEVVRNFVSVTLTDDNQTLEMTFNILDNDAVDHFKTNLKQGVDGINV